MTDEEEDFKQEVLEMLKRNNVDLSSLMEDTDDYSLCTYKQFLEVINKYTDDEEMRQFLRGCYKLYEILSPCGCIDMYSPLQQLMNILLIISKDGFISWEEKIKIFDVSENYLYLLYYILDHDGLLEHGSSLRYPWLTDKGKYILDDTYDGSYAIAIEG